MDSDVKAMGWFEMCKFVFVSIFIYMTLPVETANAMTVNIPTIFQMLLISIYALTMDIFVRA